MGVNSNAVKANSRTLILLIPELSLSIAHRLFAAFYSYLRLIRQIVKDELHICAENLL